MGTQGERRLHDELVREDAELRERVAADPRSMLAPYDLPEADKAVMARPEFDDVIREEVPEMTRNGVWGWVDDELAFVRPWGFDLAAIRAPAAVWYGAADVLVPAGHGEWLARNVPGTTVRVEQSGGHMGDPDRTWSSCTRGCSTAAPGTDQSNEPTFAEVLPSAKPRATEPVLLLLTGTMC